jgi:branched-subunit amino acid transport protein
MSVNIFLSILITSLATYLSRFLGVLSSVRIKETSKIFKWFNCLAYATLAALIARTIIFPVGVLSEASYSSRISVVLLSVGIFFITKKNFVYPTIFSAILMSIVNNYF